MAIETVVTPYEILFRLDEQGNVSGCHRRDLWRLVDTQSNLIVGEKELDPQPIAGEAMDEVLGLVNTALAASLSASEERCAQLAESMEQLKDEVAAFARENASLGGLLVAADARIAELEARHAGAE